MAKEMSKEVEDEKLKMTLANYERNLTNMLEEQELFGVQEEQILFLIDYTKKKKGLFEKTIPVVLKGLRRKNPSWDYEEDAEFIALEKAMNELDQVKKIKDFDAEVRQYEAKLKKVRLELSRFESAIPDEMARIKEMKGE